MLIGVLQELVMKIDTAKAYSPPLVTKEARKVMLNAGEAMDLTTGRDFSDKADRERAEAYIEKRRPLLLIGGRQCNMSSLPQNLSIWSPGKKVKTIEAKLHLDFRVRLYRQQVERGLLFCMSVPLVSLLGDCLK